MLVHQLRGEGSSISDFDLSSHHLALEDSSKATENDNTSADVSPINVMKSSLNIKHCNSFNSDVLENSSSESQTDTVTNEKVLSRAEKHLSADSKLIGKWSDDQHSTVSIPITLQISSCRWRIKRDIKS